MSQLSGQINITTAGTAVQGPDIKGKMFAIQANPGNTGVTWAGNDGAGDVTAANGFPLNAVGPGIMVVVDSSLNELWFDAATNGDDICWIRLTK